MGPGVGFFQTYIYISTVFSTLQLDVIQLMRYFSGTLPDARCAIIFIRSDY